MELSGGANWPWYGLVVGKKYFVFSWAIVSKNVKYNVGPSHQKRQQKKRAQGPKPKHTPRVF